MCNLSDGVFAAGQEKGEDKLGMLMTKMKADGLEDEAFRAATDREYREKMYRKYGMEELAMA